MSPATKITVTERSIGGQLLHVVTDDDQAETIRGITGTAALTKQQLGSLETLGFNVDVKKAKKKRARKAKSKAKSKGKEKIETRTNVIDDRLTQHIVVVRQFTRTFPTSNVWVLHDGNEAALIDSGFGDDGSVNARVKYLQKDLSGLNFGHIAITHHHFDHSSGARKLREAIGAMTAINPIDAALLHTPSGSNEDLPDDDEIAERARVWHEEALNAPIDIEMVDGDEFRVGKLTVSAVHTPGHTAGHNCYWVPETGTLFTGDNVLGVGTSAIGPPPSGDMEQYLQSLLRMRELQSTLMAPGHGPVVHATDAKVQELIDHRHGRDRQIIELIEHGYDSDREIRRSIYPEIQQGLLRAARGQIRSHLARLVGQGDVTVEEGEREWKVALTR
ncbi:MAG TPA: MBL fold metallo-hydrolase [Dehalococcoidia bacterium]|nr:MBL fold metallo-hydrolase [Dehalococcoidia bacterium]